MLLNKLKINLIPIIGFLLGLSLCISTALMTNTYLLLVFLSFWQKNFISKLRDSFKNYFVFMSVIFYIIFLFASMWSNAPFHYIWKMLIHIVFYLLVPFLFIIFKEKRSSLFLLYGFMLGAFINVVLSIVSYSFHHPILRGLHDYPGTVFHGHIIHNSFLAIAATICLVTVLSNSMKLQTKMYAGVLYLLCLVDIFFIVDGRTGLLMLVIMNVFSIICFVKKRNLFILLLLMLVGLSVLYKTPMVQKGILEYKSDIKKFEQGNVRSSMGYRMVFHHVSEELIRQKPIFGHGTGSYTHNFSNYASEHNISVISANPHRDLLFIGVETGFLGMWAFIFMLLAAIYEVIKLDKYYRIIGLSLILGYVSASVENSFFMDNVTGIAFVVLLLAVITQHFNSRIYK